MAVKKIRPSSKKTPNKNPKSRKREVADLEEDVSRVIIPTKRIKVLHDLHSYSYCLFGEKGIGKTSLVGQFPNHLILQFDPRRTNVSVCQLPSPDDPKPLTWNKVRKVVELLENRAESARKTIVFDIVYRAYNECLKYVCRTKGIYSHPSELNDFGKTWADIDEELESIFGRVQACNCQLVCVAHAKYKEVPLQTGSKYELLVPQSTDRLWGILRAFDMVHYYGYTGRQRCLIVRGDADLFAASGVENTFEYDNRPVKTYEMPDTAKGAYKVLQEGFNNKLEGMEYADEVVEESEDEDSE